MRLTTELRGCGSQCVSQFASVLLVFGFVGLAAE